jgi:hypothetical protein
VAQAETARTAPRCLPALPHRWDQRSEVSLEAWQSAAIAVCAIRAPTREEMPQRVQAGVCGSAVGVQDAGLKQCRRQLAMYDVSVQFDVAGTVRKNQAQLALGAGQFPLAQGVPRTRRDRLDLGRSRRRSIVTGKSHFRVGQEGNAADVAPCCSAPCPRSTIAGSHAPSG